ncbi:hypothetical protein [Hymenobacter weizhouensis]|uniref:hypothetical protein n=1 Tax=Hymenobacter sp. YIM 151500-1 TaxID=2987689 RepID=UPI0022276439|nr:hypothetical protein [Hymenobacter sp. YIM 151500-1]UYZ62201.1 hypothetical protein OIS53_14505 [Hymenobacter sp. YIM 151500-1]
MREIGIFLLLAGLIAMVAPFLLPSNFRFPLLDWMNNWGPTAAWLIKGGISLLGLALWLRYRSRD